MDGRPTWTDCDEARDYVVPIVLSPRDLVSRNDNMDETLPHTDHRGYKLWSCQNVCDALSYLLDNIYIRFGNNLYRQIVCIPMGTNCVPLVADLFFFCYIYISSACP